MTTREKIKQEAHYIVDNKATVRQAAIAFGVSKSTIHTHMVMELKKVDPTLYKKVRKVLDTNKSERHIRGGNATREKYRVLRARES